MEADKDVIGNFPSEFIKVMEILQKPGWKK